MRPRAYHRRFMIISHYHGDRYFGPLALSRARKRSQLTITAQRSLRRNAKKR